MKIVALPLLIAVLVCAPFDTVHAQADAEKAARAAAQAWLSVIDEGRYSESWKQASGYFQGAVGDKQWVASLEGIRKPLGKLLSRTVKTTKQTATAPGAPDGRYVIMQFETSFESKKSAIETVTFMLEKDGKWRAAGYFIK